jgi:hypothetical protein
MGHSFDLQEAEDVWGSGEAIRIAKVRHIAGQQWTALFADAFSSLQTAAEVNELGAPIVDRLNGLLFVRDPGRRPLSIHGVLERRTEDGFVQHVFLAAEATVRARAFARLYGGTSVPPPEQRWLPQSLTDDALADVLTFLRGQPDWFDLWKAFEMMREDIQARSGRKPWHRSGVAWPDERRMDRFEATANHHRHSRARRIEMPKDGWMSLREGRQWVAALVRPWLNWRASNDGPGP